MDRVLLMLAVGAGGGLLARRFKMPGGLLLGSMLATAIVSLCLADAQPLPAHLRTLASILLGIESGSTVDWKTLRRMGKTFVFSYSMILVMILISVGLAWMLYRFSDAGLSLMTLVLGVMPGGASGLAAAAYDIPGTEPQIVASLHLVRQIIVLTALPILLRWLVTRRQAEPDAGSLDRATVPGAPSSGHKDARLQS